MRMCEMGGGGGGGKTSLVHLPKVSVKITPGLTGFTVGVLEGSAQQANRNCQWRCAHAHMRVHTRGERS